MTGISPDRTRVLMEYSFYNSLTSIWCRHNVHSRLTHFIFPREAWQSAQFATDSHILISTREHVELWHRRRHEAWWGIVEIWEFWLAAALLIMTLVSAWKDQRELHNSSSAV
jgi:hypothetical protein